MAKFEIVIPKMGESIYEVTLTKLLKKIGDEIKEDEVFAEIATDKVDSEITSTAKGFIADIKFKEGDIIPVGEVVAIITSEKGENLSSDSTSIDHSSKNSSEDILNTEIQEVNEVLKTNNDFKYFSPLVKEIAKKENISLEELSTIKATSKDNKLTKNDVLLYINQKRENDQKPQSKTLITQKQPEAPIVFNTSSEVEEMDRMRRLIADHMTNSLATSAHVTSFIEVRMGKIVAWREKMKKIFEQKYGEKLTYTHIILELIAKVLIEFPKINASLDSYKIYLHKNINIGMATALPTGNLIVPVIKNVDQKSLIGIVKEVNKLANDARNNKLQPDDIQGGTFTFTNLGSFGSLTGTPIINQPQLAILSAGAIQKKPVVIESENGDSIGIDYVMIMSLAYDHRVVDGAMGGMFLKRMKDLMENFDINKTL